MKKILALLVAIMMLAMTIPAMAELVVIQDGVAPVVVEPAEGVVLTDVSAREEGSALAAAFAASLNHTKVVTDMFDVALTVEAPVKVTVKAQAEEVAYTVDGQTWETLAVETNGENVTFELPAAGTVALLVNFAVGMFDDISVTDIETATTEVVQQFTPSVAGKAAPALKESVNLVKGEEKTPVEPAYLVITPLALSAATSDVVTHELLQWAYNDIVNNGPAKVADQINAVLEGTSLTYDKMIVHDLFETSLYGEKGEELASEGVELSFELNAGFEDGATVVVIYSTDAENWTVLEKDNYSLLGNGEIALTMDTLGAIAFMVEADVAAEEAVTSPAN